MNGPNRSSTSSIRLVRLDARVELNSDVTVSCRALRGNFPKGAADPFWSVWGGGGKTFKQVWGGQTLNILKCCFKSFLRTLSLPRTIIFGPISTPPPIGTSCLPHNNLRPTPTTDNNRKMYRLREAGAWFRKKTTLCESRVYSGKAYKVASRMSLAFFWIVAHWFVMLPPSVAIIRRVTI